MHREAAEIKVYHVKGQLIRKFKINSEAKNKDIFLDNKTIKFKFRINSQNSRVRGGLL